MFWSRRSSASASSSTTRRSLRRDGRRGRTASNTLTFRTNVEDIVTVDAEHPLRFERGAAEGIKPYVRVRGDLWALVKRALYYDLVALGKVERWRGEDWFGVRSGAQFFPMTRASEIDGL